MVRFRQQNCKSKVVWLNSYKVNILFCVIVVVFFVF